MGILSICQYFGLRSHWTRTVASPFQQRKLCDAVRETCAGSSSGASSATRAYASATRKENFVTWLMHLVYCFLNTFLFTLFWMRLEDCLASKWAQSPVLWTSSMTTWWCFVHLSFRQVLEQCSRRTVSPQKAELPWLAVNSDFLSSE